MPLVRHGLLVVEEPDRPFLTRSLRVPDRVAAHLLGHDEPDDVLHGLVWQPTAVTNDAVRPAGPGRCRSRHRGRVPAGASATSGAFAVAGGALGAEHLLVDLAPPATPATTSVVIAEVALREARLVGRPLVIGPVDELEAGVVRRIADGTWPVVHDRVAWCATPRGRIRLRS